MCGFQYKANRILFIWAIKMEKNSMDVVSCPKVPPNIKALFASCRRLVHDPFQMTDNVGNEEPSMGELLLHDIEHVIPEGI